MNKRPKNQKQGFTLIECMISIMIIGLAFTGLALLLTTQTQANYTGHERTNAMLLAEQVKTYTESFTFDQLDTLDQTILTPADINPALSDSMPGYQTTLTVNPVSLADLSIDTNPTDVWAKRVTASVTLASKPVVHITWLRSP